MGYFNIHAEWHACRRGYQGISGRGFICKKMSAGMLLLFLVISVILYPMGVGAAARQDGSRFRIRITVGDQDFSAELYDNETARAWAEQMPMTLDMNELNGNEKYHYFSESLPTNPKRPDAIHTGDLMLYGQSCLVLFYKDFTTSYSYTPLGYMEDAAGLAEVLGSGNVTVSFRLDDGEITDEKEELRKLYEEEKATSDQGYTTLSWMAFEDARKKAKNILEDQNATAEDVQDAIKSLENAKKGLVMLESSTEQPEQKPPVKPSESEAKQPEPEQVKTQEIKTAGNEEKKISLNYKSVTMHVGDTLNLNLSLNMGEKTSKAVTWKTSNKKVASVDKKGNVKAKKTGTVTITATTKDKKGKASCKINVQKKQVSKTKILVAYFSCTNTTKRIAEKIADATGGDLYRINPAKKYTAKDLNYDNKNSRTAKEQNNKKMRPQMKGKTVSMKNYDVVFLGYPIWFGDAPRIVSTFVESYNLKGKTVVPFCTSGSSGIGKSKSALAKLSKGTWLNGRRFSGNASSKTIMKWVQKLGVLEKTSGKRVDSVMNIQIGKKVFTAKLADNSSAKALAKKLAKNSITISMQDYGDFEKVGDFGFNLVTNDKQITTEPGDLVLYEGDQLVIFYGKNSWSYTRLGKIQNVTVKELKETLGKGDVTLTLSLP